MERDLHDGPAAECGIGRADSVARRHHADRRLRRQSKNCPLRAHRQRRAAPPRSMGKIK